MDDLRMEMACIILAKQFIVDMLKQPVYKEDANTFAVGYCNKLGVYDTDQKHFLDLVKYGLEVLSIGQDSFYTFVLSPGALRFGLKNVSYEMGSFNNGEKFIYWKYTEEGIKIYQRKPIFWDGYVQKFQNKGE